ncbi:MAG: translocation/assembly module TamB domain-containing protein [Candidatus Zixiibacteriota bacterium]
MKQKNKIILSILIGAGILFLVAYLAVFHFGLLEYIVNREIRNAIPGNLPIKVNIEDISGDYLSELTVRDIVIIYEDSIESYTLANIPELTAEYSIGSLWDRQMVLEKLVINDAQLALKKGRDGKWLIPKSVEESSVKVNLFDFEVKDITINNLSATLIRQEDSLQLKNINLRAHVEGREDTYSAIIDHFDCRSSDSRYNLESSGGIVTMADSNIVFQNLGLRTDSSDVNLNGQLTLGSEFSLRLLVDAKNFNLSELSSFINAGLGGNLKINGKLEIKKGKFIIDINSSGIFLNKKVDSLHTLFYFEDNKLVFDTLDGTVLDGCSINGHGEINLSIHPEQYNFVGTLADFNLDNLVPNTFQTDLSGKINLSGSSFKSDELTMDINTDLDESWFDQYHAHKIIGFMTVTTESIRFHDKFGVKYHDNFFTVGGKLDYRGDISIAGEATLNDLTAFNNQIFIEEMGGRGTAQFIGDGSLANPNLRGTLISDSLWLYDIYSSKAKIDFDVDRFIYDRQGTASVSLYDGTAYKNEYDTLFSIMRLDTQNVYIDSFYYYNEYSNGTISGTLDYAVYPQTLMLDSTTISILGLPIYNRGLIEVKIDSLGYEFSQSRLNRPRGYLSWNGRVNYDESMNLSLSGQNINIGPWVDLFSDGYQIRGGVSGDMFLGGNFGSPVISFEGRIDSLSYDQLVLGNLNADFNYRDNKIIIDSISVTSEEGYYLAKGDLPIKLAFSRDVEDRFGDGEQNIKITAYDKRFDLVTLLMDQIEEFRGDFQADFELRGTPLKPKLNGQASVRNGVLKLYEIVDSLRNVYVNMTMIDDHIYLDSISATNKKSKSHAGLLSCYGEIILINIDSLDYSLNVSLKQFPATYELGDANGIVSGEMYVVGVTPPTVLGDIDIISTTYRENFAADNSGWAVMSELEQENSWNLNLNVHAESNLWIKNDDIDAELAGDLNFIRSAGQYRFVGTMEILRGKGYWADRDFRIQPQSTISYDDIEIPNPRLNINASTRVRTTRENLAGELEYTNVDLPILITGTLDEPIISSGDETRFSTEDILSMIFLNYAVTDSSARGTSEVKMGDRLTASAAGFLSSQFGRIGSRTLGVETFEIDPVYGDKFDPLGTKVTLGFYTNPNLYIYGRSSIAGMDEAGFEYRIGRLLLMEGKVDEDNLYQLFLNFHWDY